MYDKLILKFLRNPIGSYTWTILRQSQNVLRCNTPTLGQQRYLSSTKSNNDSSGSESSSKSSSSHEHFKLTQTQHPLGNETVKKLSSNYWDNPVPHPIYKEDDLNSVQKSHFEPKKLYDRAALFAVKLMRTGFDIVTRYRGPGGEMTKRDWMNRCLFLETVAGVPGMVAGMARHMKSLRTMQRDNGWIHTLLEEAENERMHLLIFMKLKDPNLMFRILVIGAQGIFFNVFFISYLISPRTCHRFVGYLEEEAVKTYTGLIKDIEDGHLNEWSREIAPQIAINYYKLPDDATVKDVIKCIRADEANHRDVNHTFASLDGQMDPNPFLGKKKHTK